MKHMTKLKLAAVQHKLAAVQQWCDVEEKSTEFMIQFMQDACKVDHDCVMSYLTLPGKERERLIKEVNDFLQWFIVFENLEP
jgi:hypothetical protein